MGTTTSKPLRMLPWIMCASLLFGQVVRISVFGRGTIFVHDIVLGALLLYTFFYSIRHHIHVLTKEIQAIIIPFTIFCIVALLSILLNTSPASEGQTLVGLLYLVRFIFYGSIVFVVLIIGTVRQWITALFITGVLFSIAGLVQYQLYPDLRNLSYLGWDPHYYRLFSTFLDPNFAGIFIVLTILLGFSLVATSASRKWIIIGQAINLIALVLTVSRSAILSCIAGVFVVAVALKKWTLLLFFALILSLVVFIKSPNGSSIFSLVRVNSAQARIGNWKDSVDYIKQAPIIGNGWYMLNNDTTQQSHAFGKLDSSLLFVFATTGIIGLVSLSWFIVSLYRNAYRLLQKTNKQILPVIYIASLTAILFDSFFVNSLLYPFVLLPLWILTAVLFKKE